MKYISKHNLEKYIFPIFYMKTRTSRPKITILKELQFNPYER